MTSAPRTCAGIVLAGGKSSRMGRSKALLPFGGQTLLERVLGRLAEAAEPIVVVAAVGQELPPLAPTITIVRDEHPERGPLEGLAAGLRALAGRTEAAYVTACDVPFLAPAFIRRILELLGNQDVAVPHVDDRNQPLSAIYRVSVLPHVERLLAEDRLRPVFLFDAVPTRRITSDDLRSVDPDLASLANINTPEAYEAALHRAGPDL